MAWVVCLFLLGDSLCLCGTVNVKFCVLFFAYCFGDVHAGTDCQDCGPVGAANFSIPSGLLPNDDDDDDYWTFNDGTFFTIFLCSPVSYVGLCPVVIVLFSV